MKLGESALMAMERNDQNQAKKKGKGKIPPQGGIEKVNRCFFFKKKGHMKKGCTKFQKWLEKKGKPNSFVMNLIWLMLFITHGGLILVLQSMFQIPYRVCEA